MNLTENRKPILLGALAGLFPVVLIISLSGLYYSLENYPPLNAIGLYNYQIGLLLPIALVILIDWYRTGKQKFSYYVVLIISYTIVTVVTVFGMIIWAMSNFSPGL